jgi:hypothetical protein
LKFVPSRDARTSKRYAAAVPDRRSQKINWSGTWFVKSKTGDTIDFTVELPVVEIQLGEDRGVEVMAAKPSVLQFDGNAGAVTPSKDSE